MVVEKGLIFGPYSTASVGEDKIRNAGGIESGPELLPLCYVCDMDVVIFPVFPVVVLWSRSLHVNVIYSCALCNEEF